MPSCPQCNKPLTELSRQCPTCRADLDLLVHYVNGLQGSLDRAEQLTRAGELGQAVWAYLEVLEVDPDNPAARRQVGQIATVVRLFDRLMPGRRWANGLPPHGSESGGVARWLKVSVAVMALFLAFTLGLFVAGVMGNPEPANDPNAPAAKPLPGQDQKGHMGLTK